jgi:Na+/melibiose symporter-like transporter
MIMQSNETNDTAARATVAMIFLFGAVYSIGLTPLQALYPVEVLSFEMRAKGMAFSALAVNAGNLLNQFAWPISLAKIGWKTYIVFTIWDAVQFVVFYFLLPETKKRTLEELDVVFEAKNPVKESLAVRKVEFSAEGAVVSAKEL